MHNDLDDSNDVASTLWKWKGWGGSNITTKQTFDKS